MEIQLAPKAKQDLREISHYLIQHFPEKSDSTYFAIEAACKNLIEFPEFGKIGRVQETREIKIGNLPYRIIYQITDKIVFVLRIYHLARKPL